MTCYSQPPQDSLKSKDTVITREVNNTRIQPRIGYNQQDSLETKKLVEYYVSKSNTIPNTATSTIVLGIVTGIITSGILWLLNKFRKNTIMPWIVKRLYSDIILTGTWKESYIPLSPDEKEVEGKQEQTIKLELKQKAHKIKGEAYLNDNENTVEPVGDRKMSLRGDLKDGYVSLYLEILDEKKLGVVTYLVKVTSEGDVMEGYTSYYNPVKGCISTAACILVRQPDMVRKSIFKTKNQESPK